MPQLITTHSHACCTESAPLCATKEGPGIQRTVPPMVTQLINTRLVPASHHTPTFLAMGSWPEEDPTTAARVLFPFPPPTKKISSYSISNAASPSFPAVVIGYDDKSHLRGKAFIFAYSTIIHHGGITVAEAGSG